jgi:hypothetical protein
LYLVQIAQKNLDGSFNTLITKAVSSQMTAYAVKRHFEKIYRDLTIIVSPFEDMPLEIDMSGQDYLAGIPVKYTDDEKTLHEKLVSLRDDAYTAECDLHEAITSRYRVLNYTRINSKFPMTVTTDSEGSVIKCLPIHGSAFFENVGEGKEV